MMNLKKWLIGTFMFAGVFAFLDAAEDRIEDVYDLFSPTGKVEHIWVDIDGEKTNSRVSLRRGRNPLVVPGPDGKKMEPDPKYKTVYCKLNNYGAEDNRSFHLVNHRVPVKTDEWTKVVFSFIPRRDGKVLVEFGSEGGWWYQQSTKQRSKYRNLHYSYFAKFDSENAQFKDPNFTNFRAWNVQTTWNPFRQLKAEIINEKDGPALRVMKVMDRLSQIINVKKEKEVVFSFYVKGGDTFKCKLLKEEDE